eukprot:CAMPEP_0118852586 /NCGR_PEP_ID=MMETSP1163-20130328/1513_1 /TAXON_ID=124430 /ORGANISM="Phaeomonas parva, Strain CCMP2877" /LENGTH=95 /DNA_ID=CAMNT_0006785025 /DNA_START=438 /DNA_END=722 /DNA_ORIENTATION=+
MPWNLFCPCCAEEAAAPYARLPSPNDEDGGKVAEASSEGGGAPDPSPPNPIRGAAAPDAEAAPQSKPYPETVGGSDADAPKRVELVRGTSGHEHG